MLRRRKLLLVVILSNLLLIRAVYAAFTAYTSYLNVVDHGGNPPMVSGSAFHAFTAGNHPYAYYWSTTLHHNGQFTSSYYNTASGNGPPNKVVKSATWGFPNTVSTPHSTNAAYGSYIENPSDPDDNATDPKAAQDSLPAD